MLKTLRQIVQDVGAASDLDQVLDIIVARVKAALRVDVCSVYLAEPDNRHYVLMATDGLNTEAVGKVRLAAEEGLVGLVAQRREPINLDNAPDHPSYRFFPETGEQECHAFLGVPIIHYRRVLGVLVLQHGEDHFFQPQEVDFTVTIAAQLAGAIDHALAVGSAHRPVTGNRETAFFQGVKGAPGIAIGTVVLPQPLASLGSVPDRPVGDIAAEQTRFHQAVAVVREELRSGGERIAGLLPAEEQALFDVYTLLLGEHDRLVQDTLARIREGNWAPGAWRQTIHEHAKVFDGIQDAYLRARGEDIRDLGLRVLAQLQSAESEQTLYPERCVLLGDELSVAQIARVPVERLAGIVCMRGSALSHIAILARALGIPTVMGLYDRPVGRLENREIVVDGYQGRVYFEPSPTVLAEYRRLQDQDRQLTLALDRFRDLPAETQDGRRLPLYIKAGLAADAEPALRQGADGVGLYRTEFAFMVRQSFPSEEEQARVYQEMLGAFAPRPVTMRTLDVGGDKALPYFPIHENNPFLGWRGLRLTLDHPEIFLTQLRAMLRANEGLGNLHLMFPMVTTVEEVDEALELLEQVRDELQKEGLRAVRPPIGVMIEVPSAAFQATSLARRVDFLSIGTNDLTQYLLAVDRENPQVADLYDSLHPSVLHTVREVIRMGQAAGKPVSLCGEMAGDPAAVILLLGLGIDSLSVTVANLSRVKWVIRSITQAQAQELAAEALVLESGKAVRRLLNQALEQASLGELIPSA